MGFIPIIIALGGTLFLWLVLVYNSLTDKKKRLQMANLRLNECQTLFEAQKQKVIALFESNDFLTDVFILTKQLETVSKDKQETILDEIVNELNQLFEKKTLEKSAKEVLNLYKQHTQTLLQVREHHLFCQTDFDEAVSAPSSRLPALLLGFRRQQ